MDRPKLASRREHTVTDETREGDMDPNRPGRAMQPFEPLDWVLYGLVLALLAGAVVGWQLDNWWLGCGVAGGVYQAVLLTIIALKD